MLEINESFIKQNTGDISYRRGFNYYKNGSVLSMDVEEEGSLTTIYSDVQSSQHNRIYSVEVSFDNRLRYIQCDCEAFYNHLGGTLCKHIAAVLLKYSKEKEKYKDEAASANSGLINYLRDITYSNMGSKIERGKRLLNLEVKYDLEVYSRHRISSLELKVGESRAYVVKNIGEFIESIIFNSKLEFGKNFTYDPVIHEFTPEDRKIINFLNEARETDSLLNNQGNSAYYGSVHRLLNGKKAYLTNTQIVKFFSLLKQRKIEMSINNQNYRDVVILQENMPLNFDLKLSPHGGTALSFNGELPEPIDSYGKAYFYKNNIYIPDEEQIQVFIPFINSFAANGNGPIDFSNKESEEIASIVIPSLKNISENVKIDKKLVKKFTEEPLKSEIYLDKEDEGISADIKFKYGDICINPLNDDKAREKDSILIRDVKKEMAVLGAFKQYNFQKKEERLVLFQEEDMVDFITEGISKLQELVDIFYTDSFKNIKVYGSRSFKSGVSLSEGDFLEFSFSIEGVDREELKDVFKSLRQKKKYYKLKNGGFIDLQSKELGDMGNLIEYLDIKYEDLSKDKILLSKYNALYIDQKIKSSSLNKNIERNKRFREMVNNIGEVSDMDFEVPKELQNIMRGYQKIGFKWLKTLAHYGFGGILADEMGLGKTLQTIAFIQSEVLEKEGIKKPALIVAPTSLVYNWENEVKKFAPSLNALVISGSKKEREELFKAIEASDMVITSYPLIRRDIDVYKALKFSCCILDEAQQIKNANSINAKSVKEINARGYFALTGTPIENSLMELWSIFDYIMPGYLLNMNRFSQKYEIPIVSDRNKKALEELNKHIKPFILRRLKKDVYSELPPKIEHRIIVDMTEEQKKLYAAYIEEFGNEINSEITERGFNKTRVKILSALTRLRQICCDPSVFVENFKGESGKLEALDELLEENINEGHRILLFSQFTSVLRNIENRLIKNGFEYMYLDGHTKSEQRAVMVREFNEGKGNIFLISLKAGGTGLNLTGADTVIHFDPWWNPAAEEQASDRAHRIGQKKTVEVIKLIAKGTIEEKIYNLQEKKKEIIKNVIDDSTNEEHFISSMSQEEIQELFKINNL